jgi:hypothetical protein
VIVWLATKAERFVRWRARIVIPRWLRHDGLWVWIAVVVVLVAVALIGGDF